MNTLSITKAITKTALALLFLAVTGLSILFAPELSWPHIAFAIVKGIICVAFGWVFMIILVDTMVKSVASSALEARSTRKEGGLVYHFLKPDPGEITDEKAANPKKTESAA